MDIDPYAMAGIPNPAQQQAMQEAATPQDQQGLTMGNYAQQNADLIRWQLDGEDVLIKIENLLRGNVWTGQGWNKKGKQLMNDEGIRVFLTQLSGFVHKGIIMSIYSDEQIRDRMRSISSTVRGLLYLNWNKWHVDPNDAKLIWDVIVMGQIEPTYLRALEGTQMRMAWMAQKRIESYTANQMPKQQGGGLFGWMKGGGR